jgi:molybdopterin-guanine dinucleotide biosynthesis protein A
MLTIAVQAGGESRRMGQDKGLILFLGEPLIQRVVRRVESLADEVLITTNHPEAYTFLGLPLFTDLIPGRGALGGLYTALNAALQPLVAVIACDMPFINAALLAVERDLLLETGSDAVVPHLGEGVEPFHAIYRRETCLPPVKNAIEAEKWRVDAWFSQVKVTLMRRDNILRHDPDLLSFSNVNTPDELEAAEQLARQHAS